MFAFRVQRSGSGTLALVRFEARKSARRARSESCNWLGLAGCGPHEAVASRDESEQQRACSAAAYAQRTDAARSSLSAKFRSSQFMLR